MQNSTQLENTVIALAGMFQAISLIRELTQTGKTNEAAYQASIHSIFQTDPPDVATVFGGLPNIKLGLEKLIHALGPSQTKDQLQNRYLLSLIHLQKKLSRSPKLQKTLSDRIQQTKKQVDYFHLTHPTVIANLADIYLNTISTFKFRIMILGSQRVLHVKENMEKVRTLLLAGIRATTLWRQMGGSRLQLLFSRSKIRQTAEKILKDLL